MNLHVLSTIEFFHSITFHIHLLTVDKQSSFLVRSMLYHIKLGRRQKTKSEIKIQSETRIEI